MQSVTKHRDQCPSPTGINWVSHEVSIDFIEVYTYQKCFLLIQSRGVNNSKLLRKRWSDLMRIKGFCKGNPC